MKKDTTILDSPLLLWCGRIASLVGTQLMWLLGCVPVFTIGAATKAMYANLERLRRGEECGVKTFFQAFRKDFFRTTGLWCILLVAGAALAADYCIVAYLDFPGRMAVIGGIFFAGMLLVLFSGLVFPMLSRFSMPVKEAAINGILLCFAHLPKMFLVTFMNLLPLTLFLLSAKLFWMLGVVWLTCGFGLIGLYNLKVLDKVFAPYREAAEE